MTATVGGLWSVALALVAVAIGFYVHLLGAGALDEVLLIIGAGGAAAAAALFTNGLTGRPVLGLSLPILVGWWITTALPVPLILAVLVAGLGGAVAGGIVGIAAAGPVGRAAGLTLALAILGDLVSDGFAIERLGASPAVGGVEWLVLAAALCVAAGWWSEGSLAAGLLHHVRTDTGAVLGLRQTDLVAFSSALGGVAAGIAGAILAISGAGPPDVLMGLVLAAAALAGGRTMAGTLALVAALWVLPQLALRASPGALDLQLWLAAGAGAVVLGFGLCGRHGDDDRG